MAYILGVDIGTSGTKTVLFSEDGTPVASATYEYPLYTPQNGYAEQEPLDWWNASVNGIKDVISQSNVSADDIKGVGLSGQMHGLVMLDAENQPIRKSIIWCDQRTAKEVAEITDKVGADRMIEITANPAITGFTAAKIMWVKNNELRITRSAGISSFRRITYALCLPANSQPRFPTRAECSFLTFRTAAGLTKY